MDEISEPELTLKIVGYQWFWSYDISEFNYPISPLYNGKIRVKLSVIIKVDYG